MPALWKKPRQELFCANDKCTKPIKVREVLFLCPNPLCQGKDSPRPGQPDERKNQSLFQAKRFGYNARCPHCDDLAWMKICPHCWDDLPEAAGNSSTIAVIGTSASGKTCFVTSLIHTLHEETSREDSFGIGLLWEGQKGLDYFRSQHDAIFKRNIVPEATLRKTVNLPSIQISLSVPVRRWLKRFLVGEEVSIPLVFPDPSGELFQDLNKPYYLDYLRHAEAIILMVDPFVGKKYQEWLREQNEDIPDYALYAKPADEALNAMINAVSRGSKTGKLNKTLAVVLTKCDAPGVFNPDKAVDVRPDGTRGPFREQGGGKYNPGLAGRISTRVARHLAAELGMPNLVTIAKRKFREVSFFAASALGKSPTEEVDDRGRTVAKILDPQPRRVEEPLLWILHRWGYI
ncbi:MAG: hypothetical protein U0840_11145 [Gemmataceae bacterium]